MKKDRIYIAFLIVSILAFIISEWMKPKEIDWSNDFTRNKSIPFATEILYDELNTLFPNQESIRNEESLYYAEELADQTSNWIFINSSITVDGFESKVILDKVAKGANVFIAGELSGKMADTLNVDYGSFYGRLDSLIRRDSLTVHLESDELAISQSWKHEPDATYEYFSSYDSANTEVLGFWGIEEPNFIRTNFGEGAIYLHSNPHLFTNYYLREPQYATYAFSVLSHLPEKETVWDSYYKDGRPTAAGPLSVILSTENLKQAWQLSLVALFLFMIFKARRRQRVIPIIKAPENSTLEFTKTIGMLYLEQGSHQQILTKKVQFFLDYIKTHLRLDTSSINDQLKTDLASRSGIPKQDILKLFDLIDLTSNNSKISAGQLKQVTDHIDQFYKQSQR